jgi:hypothetical protein
MAMSVFVLVGCTPSYQDNTTFDEVQGTVSVTEPVTVQEAYEAAMQAFEELELKAVVKEQDDLVAIMETTTADGTFLNVHMEYRTQDSTRIEVESEGIEDYYQARGLMDQIQANLAD